MCDGAADGAAVAHLRVAHVRGGVREERDVLGEKRIRLHLAVTGERTDGDVVTGVAHVGEVLDAGDVDEHRGLGEAQLHEREQRVASCEELRVVAVLAHEGDRLGG